MTGSEADRRSSALSQSAGRQAAGSHRHHRYHLRRQRGAVGRARPPRRSSPLPRSPARSRRSATRIIYLADGAISSNTPIKVAVAEGRTAPDHPADRLRLLDAYAAGRRGRQCAACADAPDRAAIGQRAGRPRPRHRIFRGAAIVSAGGIALRLLANRRPYRARDPEHRRWLAQEWPRERRDSRRDAPAQPLILQRPPISRCTAKGSGPDVRSLHRLIGSRWIR